MTTSVEESISPSSNDEVGIGKVARKIICDHHSNLLAVHGRDDARVVWNSRESQEARFAVLAQVGNLTGESILDVGCGLGDFFGYLNREGVKLGAYLGIDINLKMIEEAGQKYPNVTFQLRDVLAAPFERGQVDYVFGSGIFNMVIPDWSVITFGTLGIMFESCRKGLAVNFLSRLSGNTNPAARYSSPSEVLSFVERQLSTRFILRHDYRANDFTIFVYK